MSLISWVLCTAVFMAIAYAFGYILGQSHERHYWRDVEKELNKRMIVEDGAPKDNEIKFGGF